MEDVQHSSCFHVHKVKKKQKKKKKRKRKPFIFSSQINHKPAKITNPQNEVGNKRAISVAALTYMQTYKTH